MNRPEDSEGLRDQNRRRVLAEIRRMGAAARVDIAETTGLSPATVTVVAAELIAAGLIEEAPAGPEAPRKYRGRPRVMLRLVAGAVTIAGVKISDHRISVAIIDFAGTMIAEAEAPVRTRRLPSGVLIDLIEDVVRAGLQRAGLRAGSLTAIGIGLPGFVDARAGLCHWSPILSETSVPFAALVRARFGCPVFVDNDANLATLAELWFGLGQGLSDFVVVTVEHGVGMGLVIGGRLQRGARSLGAEFGHIKVVPDGAPCRCGQRGCLEAYVADYAILRAAADLLPGLDSADPIRMQEALSDLVARARGGEARADAVFREAARMLGIGLANLVNILDPAVIILSGARFAHELLHPDLMLATLQANAIAHGPPGPAVRTHIWGDILWARGAAALALDRLFDDPVLALPALRALV